MLATRPPYLKNLLMTPPCCGFTEVDAHARCAQAPVHPAHPPVPRRIPPELRSVKTRKSDPTPVANRDDALVAATVTLLGPPGSGKGTQATRLRARLGFEVFSTGDLLRTARAAGSDLGRSVAGFMDRGELVPDEVIVATIEDAIADLGDRPIVLDGFPRTLSQ